MNLTFERIIINAKKEFALLFFQARLCNGCFQVYMMGVVLHTLVWVVQFTTLLLDVGEGGA